MVSTLDFESSDPSSNLGGTLNTSHRHFIFYTLESIRYLSKGTARNFFTLVYFYNNNKQQPISFTQEPIHPITYLCNKRYDRQFMCKGLAAKLTTGLMKLSPRRLLGQKN